MDTHHQGEGNDEWYQMLISPRFMAKATPHLVVEGIDRLNCLCVQLRGSVVISGDEW